MKRKIKLLTIISSLNPDHGGPSKATIDSSIILSQSGFKVDILTSDLKGSNYFKSNKIKVLNKGPTFGNYGLSIKLFMWLYKNRKKYDTFIVHGLWQFTTLMARMLLKNKYYVFIHGMLDPWFAEDFIKKIKKKIYWSLFERYNLLSAKSLLITSLGEKNSLKNTFVHTDGIKKKIVRFGITKPKFNKKIALKKFYNKLPLLKKKKFLLFLGRFHKKKGCEIIIESVKKLGKNFNWIVLFVGPIKSSDYGNRLKKLVKYYKLNKNIIFSNALYGNLKWGAIQASEGLVLASHGENFGISLVESMSIGKPVITTFKVNISSEILKYKAGLISSDNSYSFTKNMRRFLNFNKNQLKKLSSNSQKCFDENFNLLSKKNSLSELIKKDLKNANIQKNII